MRKLGEGGLLRPCRNGVPT
ncbi:hypothetical protein R3I93_004233 [Phoxinus phoxinus]|uniref:Uncharacterized protein n=1 Tax=Phoxinus phoxinus TaxID=58324 RepID=A0AAN9DGY1_9TELE